MKNRWLNLLLRDAMRKRAVLAVARCLSVCLSVTPVYYIETAKDNIKLFIGLVSPTLLVS